MSASPPPKKSRSNYLTRVSSVTTFTVVHAAHLGGVALVACLVATTRTHTAVISPTKRVYWSNISLSRVSSTASFNFHSVVDLLPTSLSSGTPVAGAVVFKTRLVSKTRLGTSLVATILRIVRSTIIFVPTSHPDEPSTSLFTINSISLSSLVVTASMSTHASPGRSFSSSPSFKVVGHSAKLTSRTRRSTGDKFHLVSFAPSDGTAVAVVPSVTGVPSSRSTSGSRKCKVSVASTMSVTPTSTHLAGHGSLW